MLQIKLDCYCETHFPTFLLKFLINEVNWSKNSPHCQVTLAESQAFGVKNHRCGSDNYKDGSNRHLLSHFKLLCFKHFQPVCFRLVHQTYRKWKHLAPLMPHRSSGQILQLNMVSRAQRKKNSPSLSATVIFSSRSDNFGKYSWGHTTRCSTLSCGVCCSVNTNSRGLGLCKAQRWNGILWHCQQHKKEGWRNRVGFKNQARGWPMMSIP